MFARLTTKTQRSVCNCQGRLPLVIVRTLLCVLCLSMIPRVESFTSAPIQSYTTTTRNLPRIGQKSSITSCFLWSQDDQELVGPDRFRACVPYLLPLLDGERFGRYIYERVPPLGFLDSLFVGTLYNFYKGVPFFGLILFVAFTLGIRGNSDMPRTVRYNAQQAALIDVALVIPELIGAAFEGEDMPRELVEPCMTFVWYTYMAMVLYSIVANLQGKKPDQIPWISPYSELLTGPF